MISAWWFPDGTRHQNSKPLHARHTDSAKHSAGRPISAHPALPAWRTGCCQKSSLAGFLRLFRRIGKSNESQATGKNGFRRVRPSSAPMTVTGAAATPSNDLGCRQGKKRGIADGQTQLLADRFVRSANVLGQRASPLPCRFDFGPAFQLGLGPPFTVRCQLLRDAIRRFFSRQKI